MRRHRPHFVLALFLLLFLVLLAPAAAPVGQNASTPPELSEALALFQKNDHAGAMSLLQEAVSDRPDLPPAEIIMASWCADTKQDDLILRYLTQAMARAAEDPEAYIHLANINLKDSRFAEAETFFKQADDRLEEYTANPTRKRSLRLHLLAGEALLAERTGKLPKAQSYLEELLALQPNHAGVLWQLGRIFFLQERMDEAVEKFRLAAEQQEDLHSPEVAMALLYQQQGSAVEASEWMFRALDARPRDLRTRLVATEWSLATEQIEQAAQQADAALAIDPESTQAKFMRSTVALFEKDYARAEKILAEIHESDPENFSVANNLALALANQDDATKQEEALKLAEANVETANKHPEAYSTLGWVLFRLDRVAEADAALRDAVAPGRFSPDTAYYLASVKAAQGDAENSKKLLETALKTKGLFAQRDEARQLLDSLEAKGEE